MKAEKFLVIGNDKKMRACCKRLNETGYMAENFDSSYDFELIKLYDYIILPLPTVANTKINGTDITFEDFLSVIDKRQMIFCGNIDSSDLENFYSYYTNESFLLKNSRLTAQGVLRIISDNIEDDFRNIYVAVIGYGRCGRSVCKLLKNCGMNVSSFSRREETITLAEDEGFDAYSIEYMAEKISEFDIIINTVPSNILSKDDMSKLNQNNLYIEIASKPYGFDIKNTDVFNFRYILAESLPGRFTPVSAGNYIADTVLNLIKGDSYG